MSVMNGYIDEREVKQLSVAAGVTSLFSDWIAWLLILIGSYLRYDFLSASGWVIDSDEAIVGLMGKHILEGHPLPIFYYGQHYMGSLEALCAALSFSLFGVSSYALKVVPLLFSIILLPIFYLLGFTLGAKSTARTTLLLGAIPPSALILWSGMARGGFIEILVLGGIALLGTIAWIRSTRPRLIQTSFVWFVLGLGWWVNNQIVFFIIPIAIYGVLSIGRMLKSTDCVSVLMHSTCALFSFMIGSSPFWKYNLEHDFASFDMIAKAASSGIWEHFTGFLNQALPILLGAKRFWQNDDILPGSSIIAYATFGFLLLGLLIARRRQILELFKGSLDRTRPIEIFLLITFFTPIIFVSSSYGSLVSAPRYLLPMYVAILPLAGYCLVRLGQYSLPLFILPLGLILYLSMTSSYWGGRALAGQPFVYKQQRVSRDHKELLNWLASQNYHMVQTNYWIGYRLAFESNETILFSIFQPPRQVRIESYEDGAATLTVQQKPFVLVPAQAELVERGLQALNIKYRRNELSNYIVLDRFSFPVEMHPTSFDSLQIKTDRTLASDLITASATHHSESAMLAIDGDLATRWGSGAPQSPDMSYFVNLKTPVEIYGLSIELGKWYTDSARGLKIVATLADDSQKLLLAPDTYNSVRYLLDNSSHFSLLFSPTMLKSIELDQTGTDAIFDWSMAELRLFSK